MIEQIALYYKDATSDKVYNVFIEEVSGGFVVNTSWGRRGAALSTGTKTTAPVSIEKARKIYDKLVAEKMGKQYEPLNSSGAVIAPTNASAETSGISCQLLNPIEEEQLSRLLEDDNYSAQEKYDGRRQLIQKCGSDIKTINRKGLYVGHALELGKVLIDDDFVIDGELMDGYIVAFDILELNSEDIRGKSFENRIAILKGLLNDINLPIIRCIKTASSTEDKTSLYHELLNNNKEGIVFKMKRSPYSSGRPASGGTQLKYKFYKTASFFVTEQNDKRSVKVGLLDKFGVESIAGNVTIPANHAIPSPGQIVEVRYLYAFQNSGIIFQPLYLGERTDLDKEDCTRDQIVYKAEEEDTE